MRIFNAFSHNTRNIVTLAFCTLLLAGCNKALTQEDVEKKISAAREATKKAEERTREAIAAREQFYDDYRSTRTKELEGRMKDIDKRAKELKNTSKKSANEGAQVNIDAAIEELQREKEDLNYELSQVQSMTRESWGYSYESIGDAVSRIEEEISRLESSLGDTTAIGVKY